MDSMAMSEANMPSNMPGRSGASQDETPHTANPAAMADNPPVRLAFFHQIAAMKGTMVPMDANQCAVRANPSRYLSVRTSARISRISCV